MGISETVKEWEKCLEVRAHLHTQCSVSQERLSQLSPSPRLSNPVGTSLREVLHQTKRLNSSQQSPAYIPPEINTGVSEVTELNPLFELVRKRLFVEKHPWIVISPVELLL